MHVAMQSHAAAVLTSTRGRHRSSSAASTKIVAATVGRSSRRVWIMAASVGCTSSCHVCDLRTAPNCFGGNRNSNSNSNSNSIIHHPQKHRQQRRTFSDFGFGLLAGRQVGHDAHGSIFRVNDQLRRSLSYARGGASGAGSGTDDSAIAWIQRALSVTNKRKQQMYLEKFLQIYADCRDADTRRSIVEYLAVSCGTVDHEAILAATLEYQNNLKLDSTTMAATASATTTRAVHKLQQTSTPVCHHLLERICILTQDPIRFLIQLRLDLQQHIRSLTTGTGDTISDNNELIHLQDLHDHLVQHVLPLSFAKSQLEIRRITVDESTSILKYMADREAVHPTDLLEDFVQRRIQDPHKRVFALFRTQRQQQQPSAPLVVLHASLQPTIPASLRDIFPTTKDDDDENECEQPTVVATFYSISNLQPGLGGIGLGERLIRAAARRLLDERDTQVRIFTTLSPMPHFREWLEETVEAARDRNNADEFDYLWKCLDPADVLYLCTAWKCEPHHVLPKLIYNLQQQDKHPERLFKRKGDKDITTIWHQCLARLAAHYLVHEKAAKGSRCKPRNPVMRFHVQNGAQVYRINVAADLSVTGWKNSFGVMVNYRYDLDALQDNQERYEADGTMAVHKNVSGLLSAPPASQEPDQQ